MSENQNSSRRDFLGRGWIKKDPGEDYGDNETRNLPISPLQEKETSHLECYSKNAMACQFELMFNMHQYPGAAAAALAACQLIDDFEDQMSIYRDTSEVTHINQNASIRDVEVEPRLFTLLELAKKLSDATDGAFDITSGPLSDAWGFSRRAGNVPDQAVINATLENVSYKQLSLRDRSVRFKHAGLQLNLGGIGKGFALDNAADVIRNHKIDDFIIHGGQSSVVARGNNSTLAADSGWKVGLSNPLQPKVRMAEIRIQDEALGTSGTGRQGFFYQGKRYGHIIDPRTGYPTDHFLSTTVICPKATVADALATAFFVMSLDQIQSYCDNHKDIKTIIVASNSDSVPLKIETINVPPNDLKITP